MKLFSILNKPVNKVSNKQAGIVFLEYVIMAFIATVAVICAIWWLYWHLQQLTWEIKQKLEVLRTLSCKLEKPGGSEAVQPVPSNGQIPLTFTFSVEDLGYTDPIPYPNQRVTITNNGTTPIIGTLYFLYEDILAHPPEGEFPFSLAGGETSAPFDYNHVDFGDIGPYRLFADITSGDPSNTYTITVTQYP